MPYSRCGHGEFGGRCSQTTGCEGVKKKYTVNTELSELMQIKLGVKNQESWGWVSVRAVENCYFLKIVYMFFFTFLKKLNN